VDQPIELNGTLCNYYKGPYVGDSFAGHVNWFPVTLEGTAGWGDHGWRTTIIPSLSPATRQAIL